MGGPDLLVGLSAAEAARRLAADGPNEIPAAHRPSVLRRFVGELVHFFAILFWVASALAFIAGLPQLGVAVFVVILLNAAFAFAQEERAEHAAERLRDLLPRRVTVVRDATTQEIAARVLVVGDVVRLTGGDGVPADLRLEEVHAFALDTSTLTGESVPARPAAGEAATAGSFVIEGEATAVVVATGLDTRVAGIAGLTRSHRSAPTPLRAELDRLSRVIAVVAVGVGISFFGVSLLVGTPASDGFLFAVGVTVAVVPFGLLPTVTLSLAMGAQRMARRHALVRHLEAVETLGSTTFICTDKTGTLTRNEMMVREVWMPTARATIAGVGYEPDGAVECAPDALAGLRELALIAARCGSGGVVLDGGHWVARGDPMEAALVALAHRVGVEVEADAADRPEVGRFPFDPRRRRMSIVVGDRLLVKGAPDAVLPVCRAVPGVAEVIDELAALGLRLLAIAARDLETPTRGATTGDAGEVERDLVLLGLVAMEDPPREGAADAIAACRRAGIRVGMITGDHPATAVAIAREVGLVGVEARVVVGSDLPRDDGMLGALLDHDGIVVARVDPEDKLRIAQALRQRGHVVAMTGDGVNDAPALREAAIGVAMGRSGTDVAREAADLVLLDDDFATIVVAVEQGRSTFANVRRFLTYHLTDNVAELTPFLIWALSGTRFPLAIGVLQVIALDIGTDILPALALGAEPPGTHLLDAPPIRRHLLDRRLFGRAFGLLGPVEATVSILAFLASFAADGWRPGDTFPGGPALLSASGAAFTAIVFGQVANAFACRSTVRRFWQVPLRSNPLLLWAIAAELGMLAAFLYVGPIADLLDQSGPSGVGAAVAVLAAPAVLVADTLHKRALTARSSSAKLRRS